MKTKNYSIITTTLTLISTPLNLPKIFNHDVGLYLLNVELVDKLDASDSINVLITTQIYKLGGYKFVDNKTCVWFIQMHESVKMEYIQRHGKFHWWEPGFNVQEPCSLYYWSVHWNVWFKSSFYKYFLGLWWLKKSFWYSLWALTHQRIVSSSSPLRSRRA